MIDVTFGDMPEWYSHIDVLICASESEGTPNPVLEALACGVPVISTHVGIPVIASGGAGTPEHLTEVLTDGCADAALIASMTHFGGYTVNAIKEQLDADGVKVRMHW